MADILTQLKQTIMQLKEKNAVHEKTIAGMKDEQAAANSRMKELEGLREKLAKKNQELTDELATTKTSLAGAKGDAYKAEVEQTKQMLEKKNVQIREHEAKIEKLTADLATLDKKEKEAVQLNQKIPTLQGDVERLTKDKQGLEEKVKSLEEKIVQIGGDKGFKAQELLDLNSGLLAAKKEIADLKQEKAKDAEAMQNITAKVAAQDKELTALKAELVASKIKGNETLTQLEKETERAKKVDIQLSDARKEIDVLKAEMMAKSPELSEMANMKAKLQTTQDELQRIKNAHEATTKELDKTKAELEEKNKKIEQLYAIHSGEKQGEAMMELLKTELQQAKQRLDECEKRRGVLEAVNTRLSGELDTSNKDLLAEKNKPTGATEKDNMITTQGIRIRKLEEQLKASEDQVKSLNESLQKADQPELIRNLQHSNMVLNDRIKELPKLEADLASAQLELRIHRANAEEAQHNLSKRDKDMDALKETIRTLEHKIAEQNALFADLSKLTAS
jgi:chromosome segregation ATPase